MLEVWEREDMEYSFGEWETVSGSGKCNMLVRKQQGPTWSL